MSFHTIINKHINGEKLFKNNLAFQGGELSYIYYVNIVANKRYVKNRKTITTWPSTETIESKVKS